MFIYNSFISQEVVAHYQCDTWGLNRSLGSFVEAFLTDMNKKSICGVGKVKAYSDVGLILINANPTVTFPFLINAKPTVKENRSLYVANPVSGECIEIFIDHLPIGFKTNEHFWHWGIVTRTEYGVLLGYKVILIDTLLGYKKLNCLIYSSETGLWSLEAFYHPSFSNYSYSRGNSISLNGNLHWLVGKNRNDEAVLSMDFYDTSTVSDGCRVTPFPDLEKYTNFTRACTPCQGFLHYMNIVDGSKLCLWRLQSEGWQLLSEISPCLILTDYFLHYVPLMINPFDAKTAYFWSREQENLLCINLHNNKFVIHNQFKLRSEDSIMIPADDPRAIISFGSMRDIEYIDQTNLIPFVLPQWLYRIPKT